LYPASALDIVNGVDALTSAVGRFHMPTSMQLNGTLVLGQLQVIEVSEHAVGPFASATNRITCVPALRLTVTETSGHICQPPLFGIHIVLAFR
jgi:hypothetical protein